MAMADDLIYIDLVWFSPPQKLIMKSTIYKVRQLSLILLVSFVELDLMPCLLWSPVDLDLVRCWLVDMASWIGYRLCTETYFVTMLKLFRI
jgi:hypothetical protein